MRRKITFITIVVLVVILGFAHYTKRHGALVTSAHNPVVSAEQAILIEADSGKVLYEKNADQRAYPASTTKIMTALVAIEVLKEHDSPPEQKVAVPKSAEGIEGSSAYLEAGEIISIEDLLYSLMLVSGNDAAVALAEIIGGNRDNFVKMMNEKADSLGCKGTNFKNPHGLFDEEHYTTAADMATICREAMKEPLFRKIVKTKERTANRENKEKCLLRNKNKTVYEYDGGNGIKIGYTMASGRTLAASSQRNGQELICVVMSAPDWFNDAYTLMDHGYEQIGHRKTYQ